MTTLVATVALVGLAPVALVAAEELAERRAFAAEMEHVWAAETPARPRKPRPELVRARRWVQRRIDLLTAEEAWHHERAQVVRGELCDELRRRDLVDRRIEIEGQR